MLINNTYFYSGVTKIAGLGKEPYDSTVTAYVAQYEPEFLIKALGYTLYNELDTNPTEQRFIDLVEGGTYVNRHGYTEQYKGLKYTLATVNYSMIANYVYWCYLRDGAIQLGTTGTAITHTENATRVSPLAKQTIAWNTMVDQVRALDGYLHANMTTYAEWNCHDVDYSLRVKQNNLNV